MKTFRKGGIHPSAEKLTAASPIQSVPLPDTLTVMLAESIGKPAKPVVKPGEHVVAGQLIGEADGYVSANIHAPAAGVVKRIEKARTPQGYWGDAVIIITDNPGEELTPRPIDAHALSMDEAMSLEPRAIIAAIRSAGIVGLGGATFPTDVKLSPPEGLRPELLIINGAECEPYLTCDDRIMRERPREILYGASLIMRAVGVTECVVGIEANKPEAIAAMRTEAVQFEGIRIVPLRKKYPQGGEKEMIDAIMRRQVPSGQLPVSVGAIVDNVATALAVYEAVCMSTPLTHRVVTVTGPDLAQRGNFFVPIGMTISDLIVHAGGLPAGTGKVIAGGPMMGRAMSTLIAPVTKGLSGILVLPEKMSRRAVEKPCIRCGRCVDGCPMGLEPYLLIALSRRGRWSDMEQYGALDCIECGSCSWSCPADKPLLDYIKLGKRNIRHK